MFRGRETAHPHLGKRILDRIAEEAAGFAKVEAAPKLDGRNMIMVLAPDKRAQQQQQAAKAKQQPPANGETAAQIADAPAQSAAAANGQAAPSEPNEPISQQSQET